MKKVFLLTMLFFFTLGCGFPSLSGLIQNSTSGSGLQALPTESPRLPTATEVPAVVSTPEPRTTLTSGEVENEMKQIQQQVIELRGLQPKVSELKDATLTSAQLAENVKNDFFKDYTEEDAKGDVRELAAFGLLPAQFDIYKMYVDLYSDQIAGYYDPETKDMYVVQGQDFTGNEKMTYAHEYTHALQDQNWDLRNGLKDNDEYCKTHTEYCAGVQALTEGDASLTEQYWFFSDATQQDQQDVQDFYANYSSDVFDSTPLYVQNDLYFPYDQGLNFVQYLYDGGGWAAVDKAYENPPSSTEMILHPEKYPSDTQVDVPLKDVTPALGEGWKESTRNSMGEWYLSLILSSGYNESARLNEDTAAAAAAGWAGDTYTVNWNESTQQLGIILRSRWDTSKDADEFWKALNDYGVKRWGNPASRTANATTWENTADHYVQIFRDGGDIWWVIAPDAALAQKMAAAAK
jgi:hypothetical protein